MNGRRIYPPPYQDIVPSKDIQSGDYWFDEEMAQWFCCVPSGDIGSLLHHSVIEHEDKTITVSPSILVSGQYPYHGFLEHGIWREA
jgi:hypothetical protein